MTQGELFSTSAAFTAVVGLTCAHGEPWMGPHPLCAARVERDCADFDSEVVAGKYDAAGYTPNERKAQQKRKART